jgi:hypothetical protein
MKITNTVLVRNLQVSRSFRRYGSVDERVIIKLILKKQVVRVWAEFNWLIRSKYRFCERVNESSGLKNRIAGLYKGRDYFINVMVIDFSGKVLHYGMS